MKKTKKRGRPQVYPAGYAFVSLSIDAGVLAAVERFAAQRGINRSRAACLLLEKALWPGLHGIAPDQDDPS